jgi:cytochrome P450
VLAADGENWRRQRQRVQPAFHPDRLNVLERAVTEEMDALESRWQGVEQRGESIDAFKEMLELGLRILARTMFSRDVDSVIDPVLNAFRTVHRFIDPFSLANLLDPPPLVRRLLSPGFSKFDRARQVFDDVIYTLIKDRQASDTHSGDILSMLIRSRDEEKGEVMTPRQVRDEVMVTMMAGHEPTATAITWTLYLLALHPDAERRACEEVRQVLGDRRCTLADVPRLHYLKMVIEESLRIFPPAWGIDRTAVKDDIIDGYRIPAGSTVAISTYVLHHHPKYWDNPEGFDPLRFADGQDQTRPTYAYFPFGGGARRCIGFRFAMTQMPLVIATLLQRHRLELAPGQTIRPTPMLNLIPAGPVMMTPRPRAAVAHVAGV